MLSVNIKEQASYRIYSAKVKSLLLIHSHEFSSLLMKDELLWGAAWLYRASGDEYYLKYTIDNAASMGGTGYAVHEFSWDTKYAGLQVLLSKVKALNTCLEF